MGRSSWAAVVACASGLGFAPALALGDTVAISGNSAASTEGLGSFTGSVSYTPGTEGVGTLLVSLTNTTSASIGGFITALVFNINSSDGDAAAELESGPANFGGISGVNAAPFGVFDAGASTSGGFLGGGNPSRGLGIGETGEFRFAITAADAAMLSAADFVTDGPLEFNFVVRFRGMIGGGSDKVPAGTSSAPPIPLPSAAGLGAVGLALVAGRRRRG